MHSLITIHYATISEIRFGVALILKREKRGKYSNGQIERSLYIIIIRGIMFKSYLVFTVNVTIFILRDTDKSVV